MTWLATEPDRSNIAGSDANETPDPEPWDNEEGEPRSGEEGVGESTFMPEIGGPVRTGPADPVPVVITDRVPTTEQRPAKWSTHPYTLNATEAKQIASANPRRHELRITNTSESATVSIGPTESECFRTIAAGATYVTEHTAEVHALGNAATVEVDETFFTPGQ